MRLIDADAANVNDIPCSYGGNCDIDNVQMWLDEQPTVCVMNAEPVRHGEWVSVALVDQKGRVVVEQYKCSLCGRHEYQKEPYCHCGAKMIGGAK